jgi:hypothetical protein
MRSLESMKKDRWMPNRELPYLDAILAGKKFWQVFAPPHVQMKQMRRALEKIKEEHSYLCEHEPQDEFHACVLLGALNVIEAALEKGEQIYDPGE